MTDQTEAVLRTLLQDHVGEGNGITQSQLAEATGLNTSTLRSEIRRLREQRDIPIGNQGHGYYVIETRDELETFVGYKNGEIQSRKRTIEHTLAAFERFDPDETPIDDGPTCERCGDPIDGDPWLWFSVELCGTCYDDDPPGLKKNMDEWLAAGGADA